MSTFRFKQFSLKQDRSAMKVNTDGVLLGAWAPWPNSQASLSKSQAFRLDNQETDFPSQPINILDIGTGTGVIALMMAQRFPEAQVHAIDIDIESAAEAAENAANSPFVKRLMVIASSLEDYSTQEKYDLIVSNPPFFENSLQAPSQRRSLARHTAGLPFSLLFERSAMLSAKKGIMAVIVPYVAMEKMRAIAQAEGWLLWRKMAVAGSRGKEPYRVLMAFARGMEVEAEEEALFTIMEKGGSCRTAQYAKITEDFYL